MVNKTKKHKHTMKRSNSKYFKGSKRTVKRNGKSFKSKKNVLRGGLKYMQMWEKYMNRV